MEVKSKIEDLIEMTRINELLDKREAANAKKPSNVILWVLAIIGSILQIIMYSSPSLKERTCPKLGMNLDCT